MFNVGDLVTRNSYKNDIVFKIIERNGDIYYLKGVNIRLSADSNSDDLKLYLEKNDDNFFPVVENFERLDRSEYFYLPGKVLHIDGDRDYLNKCMKYYIKNNIKAYGIYLDESEFEFNIRSLLEKYKPDILVLTGHDAHYKKRDKGNQYKNTSYFLNAVKEARKYEKSHEKLFIISGACQSDYEQLIKAGSNFASSPKKINIHALDPAIIASYLAFSDKNKNIDLINILDKTKYGSDGIGGIITKGTMYIGYPR